MGKKSDLRDIQWLLVYDSLVCIPQKLPYAGISPHHHP